MKSWIAVSTVVAALATMSLTAIQAYALGESAMMQGQSDVDNKCKQVKSF